MAAASASDTAPAPDADPEEVQDPTTDKDRLELCITMLSSQQNLHEEAGRFITHFRQRLIDEDDSVSAVDFVAYKNALRVQHDVRTCWNKKIQERAGFHPFDVVDRIMYESLTGRYLVLLLSGDVGILTERGFPYKCQYVLDSWAVLKRLTEEVCPKGWILIDVPDNSCVDVMFAGAPGHAHADIFAIRKYRKNRHDFEALGLHCAKQIVASPAQVPAPPKSSHPLITPLLEELDDRLKTAQSDPHSASFLKQMDERLDATWGESGAALRERAAHILDVTYAGAFTNNSPETGEKRRRTGDA